MQSRMVSEVWSAAIAGSHKTGGNHAMHSRGSNALHAGLSEPGKKELFLEYMIFRYVRKIHVIVRLPVPTEYGWGITSCQCAGWPLYQAAVPSTGQVFLRYDTDPIMQMPWMTMPNTRFGLPMKRKVVVKIAIPQRMTMTSAGF
jgi:hypothetical protein